MNFVNANSKETNEQSTFSFTHHAPLLLLVSFCVGFVASFAHAQNHVLALDGDGDYVRIENAPELQGGEDVVKTIEAWFMPKQLSFPVVTKMLDSLQKDWGIL